MKSQGIGWQVVHAIILGYMRVRIKIALHLICLFVSVKTLDKLFIETLVGQFNQPRHFFLLEIQHFLGCPEQTGMKYTATP